MINFKNPKWAGFVNFFFNSYKISSFNKSSLNEVPVGFFKGYQLLSYFLYLLALLALFVFFITAYGPLQKLLPTSTYFKKSELIELIVKVDSLEEKLRLTSQYVYVIDKILSGHEIDSFIGFNEDSSIFFTNLNLKPSKEDSILRNLVQSEDLYNIPGSYQRAGSALEDFVFFPPVNGIVTSPFDLSEKHFGIDVVANTDASVKATLDGVVIFADWSVSGGHTVLVQHAENIVSVYMHNSSITKQNNELVKAGEVIGVVGNSGEYSSGPHLHFELWQNGVPINPIEYIDF